MRRAANRDAETAGTERIASTVLSARNWEMMLGLVDIFVYEAACATYDLPRGAIESLKLPASLAHPNASAHRMGLHFMVSSVARLVNAIR